MSAADPARLQYDRLLAECGPDVLDRVADLLVTRRERERPLVAHDTDAEIRVLGSATWSAECYRAARDAGWSAALNYHPRAHRLAAALIEHLDGGAPHDTETPARVVAEMKEDGAYRERDLAELLVAVTYGYRIGTAGVVHDVETLVRLADARAAEERLLDQLDLLRERGLVA